MVFERVRGHLMELMEELRAEDIGCILRPETAGRASQFGTLEELLSLSKEVEGVAPCVDFAHLHARTGAGNSYEEFVALLNLIERELGRSGLQTMHIHISGIDYGSAGERRHLVLADSNFRYVELLNPAQISLLV